MAPATNAPRDAGTSQGDSVSNQSVCTRVTNPAPFDRVTIADGTILPRTMDTDPIRSPKANDSIIGNPPFMLDCFCGGGGL